MDEQTLNIVEETQKMPKEPVSIFNGRSPAIIREPVSFIDGRSHTTLPEPVSIFNGRSHTTIREPVSFIAGRSHTTIREPVFFVYGRSPATIQGPVSFIDRRSNTTVQGSVGSRIAADINRSVVSGYAADINRSVGSGYAADINRDDDVELDPFVCAENVKEIKTLIKLKKLPDQRTLDKMCQIYGRKSKVVMVTCKKICEHIKSKHAKIADVWAAYTLQDVGKITFVITVNETSPYDDISVKETSGMKKRLRLHKLIKYSFVKQYIGKYSLEGSEILNHQPSSYSRLDEKSYQNLQNCISKHSEDLMKKHKYLSIISACPNRSKGFGASWTLLPENCMVLYVQKKNYIPIDEEPFETSYDSIPIDVREGAFIPYGRTATEKLDPVTMGCQIGGDAFVGTLGCFIDHPQYGVCGLTCAHVLMHSLQFSTLISSHGGMMKWPLQGMSNQVYQPADMLSVLGNIVQLIYKEGSSSTCGMDVALFRITNRQPKRADFPDATTISGSRIKRINYDSWRICNTGTLDLTLDHVVKFGSSTELRDGKIKFSVMGVKELESCALFSGCATIKLLNQIEIESHTHGLPFANQGDSGALVFVCDNNSQHTCIGIVEGGTTYGTVVVTPIVPILEELNVPGLKSFETETNLSHIHDKIANLETHINTVGSGLQGEIQTTNSNLQVLSSSIERLEQHILKLAKPDHQ